MPELSRKDLLVGSQLDYFSSAKQTWLPIRITRLDSETGAVEIDIRPGQWIALADQLAKMRPHLKPGKAQLEWVRAVMGTESFTEEMRSFFQRHARRGDRCTAEPVLWWSEMSALAADLDLQLGACGSMLLLEQEARPQLGRRDASTQEAFTLASFGCAFWKLLHNTLRDHGHLLDYRPGAPRRGNARCGAEYEVERELKRGTYGQVRLVRERKTGIRFAVKAINKAFMAGSEDMLDAEVEHLCRVDHPNIVKLHRHYEDDHTVYIVMDFCSGGDLQDRIQQSARRRACFSEAFAAHVMLQVMRAVAHVHIRGIVHLDIKALNIMLTHRSRTVAPVCGSVPAAPDHDWPHVMLIDLGIAQLFRPGNFQSGFPGGTPATMAPEVWKGEVTPAADVFSCGVVLWEVCTLQIDPLALNLTGSFEEQLQAALQFWERGPTLRWESMKHMPDSAQRLCAAMMQMTRRDRPTAQACLEDCFLAHPTMDQPASALPHTKVLELIRRIGNVPRRSILYKSMALSIARKWPSNQLPTIQQAFHTLDRARTGSLGVGDLAVALEDFGRGQDLHKSLSIAKSMDLNGDGLVDWTEFVAACVCLSDPVFEATLRHKFQKADADCDGVLNRRELVALLPGHKSDETPVTNLFNEMTGQGGLDGVDWCMFLQHFHTQDMELPVVACVGNAHGNPNLEDRGCALELCPPH